jgi:hypothetical protein
MAIGTIIVISEDRQEEMSLLSCATGARAEGLTVSNTEEALQPPFLVDHPWTFGLMRDGELAYTAKASYESWKQLKYLVDRGWSLIGNDLVILSGELKERDKLERVKNIWGLAKSVYSSDEVAEVA